MFNGRGECVLWASVGDYLKEGVAINKGIWWNNMSPGGCNSNQTTPDRLADMGGGSTYNTNLVQIERVSEDGSSEVFTYRLKLTILSKMV